MNRRVKNKFSNQRGKNLTQQRTITLINGDGIGQEVIPAARSVIQALNLPVTIATAEAGFGTFERVGDALPPETLAPVRRQRCRAVRRDPVAHDQGRGLQKPDLTLRRHFDLFANLRPALGGGIDLLVVRENTEGMYSGRERWKTTAAPPFWSASLRPKPRSASSGSAVSKRGRGAAS